MDYPQYEILNNELLLLKIGYNPMFLKEVKSFKEPVFNSYSKTWSLPISKNNIDDINKLLSSFGFKRSVLKVFNPKIEEHYQKEKIISYNKFKQVIQDKLSTSTFNITPRAYQIDHISYNMSVKRCINGSDMGTGKTFTSIFTVELFDLYPCLIIVPNSVKLNWARQFKLINSELKIQILNSDSKFEDDNQVYIINYDILTVRGGKIKLKFEELLKTQWKSLICDESQMLKNESSKRSKAVKKLGKLTDYLFMLTGTPVMNRPVELVSQLNILGNFESLFGGWREFAFRYCDAKYSEFGLEYNGASNTDELHEILKQTCYYRVNKRDVLKDLPPIQETIFEVSISNSREYNRAKNDLIVYLKEKFGDSVSQKTLTAESLVLINTLRQLSVRGKLESIKDWLNLFLESSQDKIVVFGIYNESLLKLSEHYNCDLIYGGYSNEERQLIIDYFRVSEDRILFLNMFAGGTGIDGLQNVCSDILILELPWRPTDLDQTISRIERDGQKNNISVNYILDFETIDREMWDFIESKRSVVDKINKGIYESDRGVISEVLRNYLKRL